jgi:hypothetical protein
MSILTSCAAAIPMLAPGADLILAGTTYNAMDQDNNWRGSISGAFSFALLCPSSMYSRLRRALPRSRQPVQLPARGDRDQCCGWNHWHRTQKDRQHSLFSRYCSQSNTSTRLLYATRENPSVPTSNFERSFTCNSLARPALARAAHPRLRHGTIVLKPARSASTPRRIVLSTCVDRSSSTSSSTELSSMVLCLRGCLRRTLVANRRRTCRRSA